MTSRDIARISFEEVAAAAPGQSSAHYVIEATCLGLYGPDSPLPAYVNERIVARDRDATALRDFLDLFNHRILTLLCRIARRYRHIRVFDGAATDEIRQMVDILGRRLFIARHFKAALLARMRVVARAYVPLTRILRPAVQRPARRYRHIRRSSTEPPPTEIRQMAADILGRRRKNNPIARHFKAALLARDAGGPTSRSRFRGGSAARPIARAAPRAGRGARLKAELQGLELRRVGP